MCSVLQCVAWLGLLVPENLGFFIAVCVAVCGLQSVLQCALQCIAVRCSAVQRVAVRCSVLQCVAVCCSGRGYCC